MCDLTSDGVSPAPALIKDTGNAKAITEAKQSVGSAFAKKNLEITFVDAFSFDS
jgi:hypothetical protein